VRRYRPSQAVMKSAEEIFEKFKQIFQGNRNTLNTPSAVYELPAHQLRENSPLSPGRKTRIKNADQPSKPRKFPPPMKPQRLPSTSRPPSHRVTSRVYYNETLHSPSDELDTDSSEFEQSSLSSSSNDDAAGQQFSYDDQCVPEL